VVVPKPVLIVLGADSSILEEDSYECSAPSDFA